MAASIDLFLVRLISCLPKSLYILRFVSAPVPQFYAPTLAAGVQHRPAPAEVLAGNWPDYAPKATASPQFVVGEKAPEAVNEGEKEARKQMDSRSEMWNYFKKILVDGVLQKGKWNYCKSDIAAHTATNDSKEAGEVNRCED